MADRIEQEIEEILAKLDVGGDEEADRGSRRPIPISGRRRSLPASAPHSSGSRLPNLNVTPATLLLTGAAVMVVGMVGANWWEPLIWLSFGGVVLFLAAFAWSFRRHQRQGAVGGPQTVYWRDRYIDVSRQGPGGFSRIRRIFRRR